MRNFRIRDRRRRGGSSRDLFSSLLKLKRLARSLLKARKYTKRSL